MSFLKYLLNAYYNLTCYLHGSLDIGTENKWVSVRCNRLQAFLLVELSIISLSAVSGALKMLTKMHVY